MLLNSRGPIILNGSHSPRCLIRHFIIALLLTPVFGLVPVFGQSMGTSYSDIWLAGVNQPYTDSDGYLHMSEDGPPQAYVEATEITDGTYSSYSHYYDINASLNSTGGRSTSGSTSGGPTVRVDLALYFDIDDTGVYYATHTSSGYCPGANSYHTLSGAGSSKTFGVSYSVFQKAAQISSGHATYQLIQPCDVNCIYTVGTGLYRVSNIFPQYVRFAVPWVSVGGYTFCEELIVGYTESDSPMSCFELSR